MFLVAAVIPALQGVALAQGDIQQVGASGYRYP